MNLHPESLAHVIADYHAPYADPIQVSAGDEITVDRNKETDIAGWVWCTNRAGQSGWVPETYVAIHSDIGNMLHDYDAIELTVHVGDVLTLHQAESGFFWSTDQAGRQGWVPSTHVEPSDIE